MMRIYGKLIEFELQVDETVPAKLIGDEIRIKQILSNLLSNAFKYTDEGKVTLTVVSEAWPSGEGVTLVLIVRDSGRGMSKKQLGELFDEYTRFNQETSRGVEGTGLGLAITQRLVGLMGGGIAVDSELGAGTVFVVRLPQGTVGGGVIGKEVADNLRQFKMSYVERSRRGQIMRDPMPYGSILIVDDVEANLYVAEGLMKPYGLKLDSAMSGQAAIDKIRSGLVYDLVFMDHMMPTLPIIALTANVVGDVRDMFLKSGMSDFLSKPLEHAEIERVLRDWLPREKWSNMQRIDMSEETK
jgi:CheY-like chemotaxis protein